jgi:hypothetical protein
MNRRMLLATCATVLLSGTSLTAQSATTRTGYTVDAGLAGGSAAGYCTDCLPSDANATSGFLRVGRFVASDLAVSLEWTRSTRSQFGQPSRFEFVTAGVQWYPLSRLSTRYAIGYGNTSYAQVVEPNTYRTERAGLAYQTSIGYDIPVSEKLVVSPFVAATATVKGRARVNGQVAPYDVSTSLFQYGMSLGLR